MKKIVIFILLFHLAFAVIGQQMPYYTQNKSNAFMINPAIAGTKRLVDARMNYRMQWVGYEGAPRTYSLGIHSRFYKGKMGAGMYLMQDNVGPAKQMNLGAAYAFHIRFPDVELSAGLAGNFTKYTLIGDKMFLHNRQDPSIDQNVTNSTWVTDASAGIYLYNDRFHVGLSGMHVLQSTAEFYKADTTKKGLIKYATHANFTLGYNYSQNPDFVWESTLYGNFVAGAPLMLDYTLRLHVKEMMFGGVSLRLRDAVALHIGATILNDFQVSYSYDILISKFRAYSSGSHEFMLAFSSSIFQQKKGRSNDKFLHQRYGYLF
ncbi:MAG: PorP/SprF family type IX secretion system membrane protein [Bacteroidia bacterium]|nr:PorP/SprF family type IX secretion system membrane protein [Bacteroidia bacterium]